MLKSELSYLDRGRGFLTDTDRRYLLGKIDYDEEPQQERNRRRAIRNRTVESFGDFSILEHYLSNDDQRQVFHKYEENGVFEHGVKELIQFLYRGLKYTGADFTDIFEEAVEEAERKYQIDQHDRSVDVDVDLSIETEDSSERTANEIRLMNEHPIPHTGLQILAEGQLSHELDPATINEVHVAFDEYLLDTFTRGTLVNRLIGPSLEALNINLPDDHIFLTTLEEVP